METTFPHTALASIGIDIGEEVFHIVAFGTDGHVAFRRKIKRLALDASIGNTLMTRRKLLLASA